jgi:hypothetical protein
MSFTLVVLSTTLQRKCNLPINNYFFLIGRDFNVVINTRPEQRHLMKKPNSVHSPKTMLLTSLLFLTTITMSQSTALRGSDHDLLPEKRRLASPYFATSDAAVLGAANPDAAVSNPLKGLATKGNSNYYPTNIPTSLEHDYIGLDTIMTGPNQFDWSVLDGTLAAAASRNNHAIWRVYCHFPGEKLAVPQYLIDAGTKLVTMSNGDISPLYDDPILLNAFNQFIAALGARYDGHKSLAFIQLGLLGEW